jgi:hypothetical protein
VYSRPYIHTENILGCHGSPFTPFHHRLQFHLPHSILSYSIYTIARWHLHIFLFRQLYISFHETGLYDILSTQDYRQFRFQWLLQTLCLDLSTKAHRTSASTMGFPRMTNYDRGKKGKDDKDKKGEGKDGKDKKGKGRDETTKSSSPPSRRNTPKNSPSPKNSHSPRTDSDMELYEDPPPIGATQNQQSRGQGSQGQGYQSIQSHAAQGSQIQGHRSQQQTQQQGQYGQQQGYGSQQQGSSSQWVQASQQRGQASRSSRSSSPATRPLLPGQLALSRLSSNPSFTIASQPMKPVEENVPQRKKKRNMETYSKDMATDWNCCQNSMSVPHLRSNPYSTRRCSNITGKKVKNKMGQVVDEVCGHWRCYSCPTV